MSAPTHENAATWRQYMRTRRRLSTSALYADRESHRMYRARTGKEGGDTPGLRRFGRNLNKLVRRGEVERPSLCPRCGVDPGLDHCGHSLIHARYPGGGGWMATIRGKDIDWRCSLCAGEERWDGKHKA